MEMAGYILGFATLGVFLYFMWIDTKPQNHYKNS